MVMRMVRLVIRLMLIIGPLTLPLAVIVALAFLVTSARSATECQVSPGMGFWMWRTIDNRRCWYPGRQRLEKSQLQWVSREEPQSPVPAVEPAAAAPPEEEATGFAARWPSGVDLVPPRSWLDKTPVERWRGTMQGGR